MWDLLRSAWQLVGADWRPWGLVVALALAVSAFEAVGAVLLFAVLALMTTPGAIVFPVFGDLRGYLAGLDETELYLWAAGALIVFFLLRAAVVIAQTYVRTRVTEDAGARLSRRLHEGYLASPTSSRGGRDTAEQVRNAHDTAQRFVEEFFWPAVMIVSEVVLIVVLVALLLLTSPMATLLVIAVVTPVVLILNRIVEPRLRRLGGEMHDLSRRSLQLLRESLDGHDDIRLVGGEPYFVGRFAAVRRGLARDRYLRETLGRIPAVGLETALVLFVAIFLAATVLVGDEALRTLPVLGLFGYVGLRILPALEGLVVNINALQFAGPAVEDIHRELRRVEPWLSDAPWLDEHAPLGLRERITLEGVSYRYPGAETAAIIDVDLTINRGQHVGLVGSTGGGKSTLMELITGLRRPTAGSVRVDGADVRERLPAWFATLGVVPQRVFLTNDTLRRNIALGVEDDRIDGDRLGAAVRIAQLEEMVASLPRGLDTVVGEQGTRLSGGQRQRVAIARVVYRDPGVILLDEGTAALDTTTEDALMDALTAELDDRTMVIVAHRLSTVRDCDTIHLVEGGRIVASGSYRELERDSPRFRELARTPDGG